MRENGPFDLGDSDGSGRGGSDGRDGSRGSVQPVRDELFGIVFSDSYSVSVALHTD